MGGEIDAMAELGTAALVADAIDTPRPGKPVTHDLCANCNAALSGNFCHACGQRAHLHRSLADVGHEFIHGITHFDGKAWTTLPMLLFRPGKLTREYIMGRRARYVAPVPLFLLVVFLMFFVFSFVGIKTGGGVTGDDGKPLSQAEAIKGLPGIDAELRDLDRQIAAATAKGDTASLPGLKGARTGVAAVRGQVEARAQGVSGSAFNIANAIRTAQQDGTISVDFGNDSLNIIATKALKNPELALYKIQGKAYKLSFLLVPLSLPWLWLIFAGKSGVRMYDHAIFALYSISFMSLLFVAGSVALALDFTWEPFWFGLLFVAPIAHMFAQLKGAYALRNFSAAWRTMLLSSAAFLTLVLYAILMIVLGVLD